MVYKRLLLAVRFTGRMITKRVCTSGPLARQDNAETSQPSLNYGLRDQPYRGHGVSDGSVGVS